MSTTKASTRSGEPGGSGEPTRGESDSRRPSRSGLLRDRGDRDPRRRRARRLPDAHADARILRDRTLTMARLADFLGLERSTGERPGDRAERRGLVERQTSTADGRSTELRLTRKGQEQAQIAATEVAARVAPIVHDLPEELRRSLPGLLEALRLGKPGLGLTPVLPAQELERMGEPPPGARAVHSSVQDHRHGHGVLARHPTSRCRPSRPPPRS
ncbi:MAG: MarR family winged helix-turn-helix transcriptional regulator [Galbitalea sp.]